AGDLKREFHYYLEHQDELVEKYNGKVIAIKNREVIGVFNSLLEALTETCKDHEIGTFLIQKCSPGDDDYSMTFHSRVCFA
ncbi:MAG: hypothetical protein ACC742_13410, partial [Thermoanaerobaculales bacterium]